MAKLTEILNDRQLKAWRKAGKPIAGKSDGGGLTFTLSKGGTATWIFRYRVGGRPKELTLGNYPDISLTEARELARDKRVQVDKLVDVAAEKQRKRQESKKVRTVAELAEAFLAQAIKPRYKYPRRVESTFKRDVLPVLGTLAAPAVTSGDVDRLLRRIAADGRPTVANDALRLVRRMFAWGSKRGMVTGNPAADFELEDAGGEERARTRTLSRQELMALFRAIRAAGAGFTRDNELAVKLLLALGVRKMELLAARWDEFAIDDCVWYLPDERAKTGDGIDIPLAAPVVEWLRELHVRACGSAHVFPARRTSKRFPHVSPDTLNVALKDLEHGLKAFTVHDLRRTARTLLAELGVQRDVAERCLNHKLRGVEGTYNRHDYFDERKAALAQLADLISALEREEADNVVPLRGRRGRSE